MTATFSADGVYRYTLERDLADYNVRGKQLAGACLFVMLNPSTADEKNDDPTIRRCIGFALRWKFRRLLVGNIFAYRATNPSELAKLKYHEAVGSANNRSIVDLAKRADRIVCAWGNHGSLLRRGEEVHGMLVEYGAKPLVLGLTKIGQPAHPLYLPADLRPRPWLNAPT